MLDMQLLEMLKNESSQCQLRQLGNVKFEIAAMLRRGIVGHVYKNGKIC